MLPIGSNRRRGVARSQVLVPLALALVGLGAFVPALARARAAAQNARSQNHLRMLAIAVHSHNDTFACLPPIAGQVNNRTGSLHFFILPFMEQGELWNASGNAVWVNDTWSKPVEAYADPDDPSAGPRHVYKGWLATTSYAGNWLVFREGKNRFPQSIPDGISSTLLFAQRYQMCRDTPTAWGYPSLYTWSPAFAHDNLVKFQTRPKQSECDPTRPHAFGPALLTVLCDGAVRPLNPAISSQTWASVCDPSDGKMPGDDF
jgi:Protein of unknown function (DUF1559)